MRGELIRDGEVIDVAATDEAGVMNLTSSGPGSHTLLLERIGYENQEIQILVSAEGIARIIAVRPLPFEMPTLRAEATSRCPISEDPQAVLRAREMLRPYLDLVTWADTAGHFVYQVALTERLLNPYANGPRPSESESLVTTAAPVVSDEPLLLAARGFADVVNDTVVRYLPLTARVLASDGFAETHCFSLSEETRRGQTGLTFAPMSDRRVVDVAGVVWMDSDTGSPLEVDYEFVRLEDVIARDRLRSEGDLYRRRSLYGRDPERYKVKWLEPVFISAPYGGSLVFEQLADGLWVTRSWRVRGPIVWSYEDWHGAEIEVRPYVLGRETEAIVTGIGVTERRDRN